MSTESTTSSKVQKLEQPSVPDWEQMNDNLAKIVHYYQHQLEFTETLKSDIRQLTSTVNGLKSQMTDFSKVLNDRSKEVSCLVEVQDVLSSTLIDVMGHIHSIQESVVCIQTNMTDVTEVVSQTCDQDSSQYTKLAKFTREQLDKKLGPVLESLKSIMTMIDHRL